jgi:ion channel-forming bestrophin family protein
MHAGRKYSFTEILKWTRREIYLFTLIAIIPAILFQVLNWHWLAIPWVPIALVGTAAAFIVGFRNTQTYNRLWEARQIYGAIVNTSRSWGMLVKSYVKGGDEIHRQLIYRHIAWLTALRFQLRESRTWENVKVHISNVEYSKMYNVPEWNTKMEDEIKPFLSYDDMQHALAKKNKATHIVNLQSLHLKTLKAQGLIDALDYIELEKILIDLYEQQGKCERIKNFPYPRQFSTINQMFVKLFVVLIPFGMLNEFQKLGEHMTWLTIPFSVVVSWMFLIMERVGEITENPFEGSPNDVPITALSRTIEIDLREMLNETDLPPAITPIHEILM